MKLLDFFKKYENQDGLLEKLPSWVFVEWSAANNFVQDVNYPSNMLYAGVLWPRRRACTTCPSWPPRPNESAKRSDGSPSMGSSSSTMRFATRKASWKSRGIGAKCVNTLPSSSRRPRRKSHRAIVANASATSSGPETERDESLFPSPPRQLVRWQRAAVGACCRRPVEAARFSTSRSPIFLYMADRTGTLWENVDAGASCDHGFRLARRAYALSRCVGSVPASTSSGSQGRHSSSATRHWSIAKEALPTPDGVVHLEVEESQDGRLEYHLDLPAGYEATIANRERAAAVPRSESLSAGIHRIFFALFRIGRLFSAIRFSAGKAVVTRCTKGP